MKLKRFVFIFEKHNSYTTNEIKFIKSITFIEQPVQLKRQIWYERKKIDISNTWKWYILEL